MASHGEDEYEARLNFSSPYDRYTAKLITMNYAPRVFRYTLLLSSNRKIVGPIP